MLKLRSRVLPWLAFLPWLAQLPYMMSAWKSSPLDRRDWIFVVLFPGFFSWVLLRRQEKADDSGGWTLWMPFAAGGLVTALGMVLAMHMIVILGSILIAWGMCIAVLGKEKGGALVLPFALLALGTTSTTYYLSVATGFSGDRVFLLKLVAAALLTVIAALPWRIRPEPWLFLAALAGGVLCVAYAPGVTASAPPLRPEFTLRPGGAGGLIGAKQPLPDEMRRFFRKSEVNFLIYADDRYSYQVLEVRCPRDIHEIHPASHCLKSGGATVLAENIFSYRIHNQTIPLLEIVSTAPGRGREFHVVWYADPTCSVASFPAFRARWRPRSGWTVCQITTQLDGSPENARERVRKFLESVTAPE